MFADAPSHGKEYHDLESDKDNYYTADPLKNKKLI